MNTLAARLVRAGTLAPACAFTALANSQPTDHKAFDYQGGFDNGQKVVVDREGSIYVAGTGTSSSHGTDFILVKYTVVAGVLTYQWDRNYDGPGHGDDTVTGLVLDSMGNVFVSGTSLGSSTGYDAAVIGWDKNGLYVWSAGDYAVRYNSSGSHNDYARDMTIDGKDNLLICGDSDTASSGEDGFVLEVTAAGAIKTGWPQTYDSGGADEYLYAIATDPKSNVYAVGKESTASNGTDMLMLRYAGGGTNTWHDTVDYAGKDDVANAVTYTKNDRVAVAGSVTTSGSQQEFAVYAFDPDGSPVLAWSQVYGTSTASYATAITYSDSFVFATGSLQLLISPSFLTMKLELAGGTPSSTWVSTGLGGGIRALATTSRSNSANAIHVAGSDVYITGVSTYPGAIPPNQKYLTTRYSIDGTTPSFFTSAGDLFPAVGTQLDFGNGLTVFSAGQLLVTGQYLNSSGNYDFGTLLYAQPTTQHNPTHTTEVGTDLSGNDASLATIDGNYLVTQSVTTVNGAPPVVVRCDGNVGTATVSELCFDVVSKVSTSGLSQEVQMWNYTSGQWDQMDYRVATTSDRLLHVNVPGDPAINYIDQSTGNVGNVKARLRYYVTGLVITTPWTVSLDQAVWKSIGL